MRILLTNDDGVAAPGLLSAKNALDPLGEVVVVAPERPRSASGHAITLHKPLRLCEAVLADGSPAWATSGTPSDCVTLGFDVLMNQRVDLVVAGINAGANLGFDLTYSGTVMAAMEGAILGVPSIAVSVVGENGHMEYGPASAFAAKLARLVEREGLDRWTLLNVNVPSRSAEDIRGVRFTRQGRTQYDERVERRTDPWGRAYYWLSGSLVEDDTDHGSDVQAVKEGYISVTPVQLDMTATQLLARMKDWEITK